MTPSSLKQLRETIAAEGIALRLSEDSPLPKEWFPRAFWLKGAAAVLRKVLSEVEAEYKRSVEVILDDGLTDERYELVPLFKQERMLDADKLKRDEPALYEQCAFVDADLMVKTLGKPVLRQMMIEKLGKEKVSPLESVTIESVKEIVGDVRVEDYITRISVPNGYVIREKEGS